MTLHCPNCSSSQFAIIDSVEIGRKNGFDEETVQRAKCPSCGVRFVCHFTSRRSFRPDRDDDDRHVAFPTGWWIWLKLARACEAPQRKPSDIWRIKVALAVLGAVSSSEGVSAPIPYRQDTSDKTCATGWLARVWARWRP